jgi:hypothetical protein
VRRDFCDDFGWVRLVADKAITEALVKREQLVSARADDAEIHLTRPDRSCKLLGGFYQAMAQAATLVRGLDGKEAEIGAIIAWLDEDAAEEGAGHFGEQEMASRHVAAHAGLVDTIAIERYLLDNEGGID